MRKKLISAVVLVAMLVSCAPMAYAATTEAPVISVDRESIRSNTLLVTSKDSEGTFYDVAYKFSKSASDTYTNLTTIVSAPNQAAVLLPEDFGDYYLYAKSSNGEATSTKMFGPYNVGNKGFITINSSAPNPNSSYDSFAVKYSLTSPYSGASIDLSQSEYCWTTSATSNAGVKTKFGSTVGTINSPVGVKGTYYLHMSVVDSKGNKGYEVVGPVVLNGLTQSVYFSGIKPNVAKQVITINVGVPAPQVNFGESGYQIVKTGSSVGSNWTPLTGSATSVTVSQTGSYKLVVKLKTTDGNTNQYSSEVFSVGSGENSSGSAKATYNPSTWTNGSVKATLVVTDSYGNRVEPVTSGIVRKSDTTYEYTMSQNGSYVLEWANTSGGVIRTTLQVNWIDPDGPTIRCNNDYDEFKVTLSDDKSGVDFSKSVIKYGDEEEKIDKVNETIFFDDYLAGDVCVIAYDKAGNVSKRLYYVENLPSNWAVDIEYDKINKDKWEAIIDIDDVKGVGYEIVTKNGWVKNPDGTFSVFFDANGSKELSVKTTDKKTFDILLRMDKLEDREVEVSFNYKKLDRPSFELDYDSNKVKIDWDSSYYRLVGEKKNTLNEDEEEYTVRIREDGEYQIEVALYTINGDRYKYSSDYIVYGGTNQGVYDKDAYEDGDYVLTNGSSNNNTNNNTPNNTVNNLKSGTAGLRFKTQHTAYLSGYGNGYYGLSQNVTRGEFYALLDRLVDGGTQPNNVNLTDVRYGDWYYVPVTRFVNMGVVHLDGNYLNPASPITRAEVAYSLNRLGTNRAAYNAATFSDLTGHWASDDIIQANRKGLVAGYTDGTFKPNNFITRAECVAMLNRAAGRTCAGKGTQVGSKIPSPSEVSSSYWAYRDIVEAINNH